MSIQHGYSARSRVERHRGACLACEADGEQGEWRETSETHLRSTSYDLERRFGAGVAFASVRFQAQP